MSASDSDEIIVEQLNATQWHACFPGRRLGGINDWCTVVADALVWGELDDCSVTSLALDGTRMLLARSPTAAIFERGV